MGKLENKVAVITGGNSGIGLATAKKYQDEGAQVVITASTKSSFERARAEFGQVFDVVQTDVTDVDQISALADHVREKYGRVDVLFANAGIAHFLPVSEVTPEFFDQQFNTNVKGLLFTVQKFMPLLERGASVILTSSGVHSKGLAGSTVYAATKAAVRSLTRSLAAELIPRGIRVNTVTPGPIETPIYSKMKLSEEQLKGFASEIQNNTPIGRFGAVEEIASVALFLASEDSSYLVGSEVVADGGFSQL